MLDPNTMSEDELFELLSGTDLTPSEKRQLQDEYNKSHNWENS